MNRFQVREHRLHAIRQCLVGHILVGKRRLATLRRQFPGPKNRNGRGRFIERHVRVPAPPFESVRDVDWQNVVVVLHPGGVREAIKFAETPREGDLIVSGKLLIGKHQDHVFQKRLAHFIERCVVERAQVDLDLGADLPGEGRNVQCLLGRFAKGAHGLLSIIVQSAL